MTSHPSRNNRELRDNANEPIRFLLISNMYPGRHHLFFGIFVRNTEKGLVENGIEVDRIVISDKSRKIFEKIWKYLIFYLKILTAQFNHYDVMQSSYPSHTYLPFFPEIGETSLCCALAWTGSPWGCGPGHVSSRG